MENLNEQLEIEVEKLKYSLRKLSHENAYLKAENTSLDKLLKFERGLIALLEDMATASLKVYEKAIYSKIDYTCDEFKIWNNTWHAWITYIKEKNLD